MKVLVTGANGYIGRHLINALANQGHDVVACDICFDSVRNDIKQVKINIFEDHNDIFKKLGCPDVCIHLAWRDGFIHNSDKHIGDLSSHFKFLTSMINGGLKHLSVMGTMHEVGYWEGMIEENTPCHPQSMYGIAKNTLRESLFLYVKGKDVDLKWLRAFYRLGDDKANNSIFSKIIIAAEKGQKTFPFTSGRNKYDFLNVEELASQIAAASTQQEISGIINCCKGTAVSLASKVESFIMEKGLDIKLEYGAYPDRPYDSPCIYGDPSKINAIMKLSNNLK